MGKKKRKKLSKLSIKHKRKLLLDFLKSNNWMGLKDKDNAKGVVNLYLEIYIINKKKI